MRSEDYLNPADRELEQALRGLAPTPPQIDRDRLMFEAGRQSSRGALHRWQLIVAVLAIGVGVSLAIRPAPTQVEKPVHVERPREVEHAPAPAEPPGRTATGMTTLALSEDSYLAVQRRVLAEGLDALPRRTRPGGPGPKSRIEALKTIRGLNGDMHRFARPDASLRGGQS